MINSELRNLYAPRYIFNFELGEIYVWGDYIVYSILDMIREYRSLLCRIWFSSPYIPVKETDSR